MFHLNNYIASQESINDSSASLRHHLRHCQDAIAYVAAHTGVFTRDTKGVQDGNSNVNKRRFRHFPDTRVPRAPPKSPDRTAANAKNRPTYGFPPSQKRADYF